MNRKIIINQIGYGTAMPKTAVYLGEADSFLIVNAENGKTVFSGLVDEPAPDEASSDVVSHIDFSDFRQEGKFYIKVGRKRSAVFSVSDRPYKELKKALLKGLYFSRCGALDKKLAGEYCHGSCHKGSIPLFDAPERLIDVSGGWHDSGGYGKFTVCTCITLGHLLNAYRLFPESFSDVTGIPESGNGVPDILNECRFGLEWLLKMQTRDGGVYHKVAAVRQVPVVMPDKDLTKQFVFPCSHQAAACFSAVTSLASRVFRDIDGDFSEVLYEASIKAWIWLMNHPDYAPFENPPKIAVSAAGDFYDDNFNDDLFWALCELYETTGDEMFHGKIHGLYERVSAIGFVNRDNGGFGAITYLFGSKPRDDLIEQSLKLQLRVRADNLYSLSRQSGYGTAKELKDYIRGSNMYSMTDSIALILAYKIFGCREYFNTACEQLSYILGKNPMGICYVTGFGSDSVKHPHHRPSEADDIEEPVPGLLVCGPSKQIEDGFSMWNIPSEAPPAKCYYDILYSFSTNETTIYCNSAAIFVAGYLDSEAAAY